LLNTLKNGEHEFYMLSGALPTGALSVTYWCHHECEWSGAICGSSDWCHQVCQWSGAICGSDWRHLWNQPAPRLCVSNWGFP